MADHRTILPSVYAVGDQVKAAKAQNPQLTAQYDSLEGSLETNLKSSPLTALRLERNLRADPVFREQVRELATRNPAQLEKILPEVIKSPDKMKEIVAASAGQLAPAQAQVRRADTAVATATPPEAKPEPLAVAAKGPAVAGAGSAGPKEKGPVQRVVEAVIPAAQAAVPVKPDAAPSLDKIDGKAKTPADQLLQLSTLPGFDEFSKKVEKNQHLNEALSRSLKAGGDAQSAEMIATLYEQAKGDPQFFNKLNKTIDNTPPNLLSTFARQIADSPKTGMMMFGMYNELAGSDGIMGNLVKSPMFNQLLTTLIPVLGKIFGALFGAMDSVQTHVSDRLGASRALAVDGNPELAARAMKAAGANPESVKQVGRNNETVEEFNQRVEANYRKTQGQGPAAQQQDNPLLQQPGPAGSGP